MFLNSEPGFRTHSSVVDFIRRNFTPPYVSNHADIRHVDLRSLEATDKYLVLCSDGLIELYDEQNNQQRDKPERSEMDRLSKLWIDKVASGIEEGVENSALHLLRDALGGEDEEKARDFYSCSF